MTEKNTMTLLAQCIDMLADQLGHAPLEVERPGKDNFILVAAPAYDRLIERLHDLEQDMMIDDDRDDEDDILLSLLSESETTRH